MLSNSNSSFGSTGSSMTFPILEGLLQTWEEQQQQSTYKTANSITAMTPQQLIVREALAKWKAATFIARWVERRFFGLISHPQSHVVDHHDDRRTTHRNRRHLELHWLWTLLSPSSSSSASSSSSIPEQRLALQLFCQGLPAPQPDPIDDNDDDGTIPASLSSKDDHNHKHNSNDVEHTLWLVLGILKHFITKSIILIPTAIAIPIPTMEEQNTRFQTGVGIEFGTKSTIGTITTCTSTNYMDHALPYIALMHHILIKLSFTSKYPHRHQSSPQNKNKSQRDGEDDNNNNSNSTSSKSHKKKITEENTTTTTTKTEEKKETEQRQHPFTTNVPLAFLHAGGLSWLCHLIYQVSLQSSNSSGRGRSSSSSSSSIEQDNPAVTAVCASLIHLLQKLLWKASILSKVQSKQTSSSSSTTTSVPPTIASSLLWKQKPSTTTSIENNDCLTQLIASYWIWKQVKASLTPFDVKGILGRLKQLMNTHHVVMNNTKNSGGGAAAAAAGTTGTSTTASDKTYGIQAPLMSLMDTLKRNNLSAATEAATSSTNVTNIRTGTRSRSGSGTNTNSNSNTNTGSPGRAERTTTNSMTLRNRSLTRLQTSTNEQQQENSVANMNREESSSSFQRWLSLHDEDNGANTTTGTTTSGATSRNNDYIVYNDGQEKDDDQDNDHIVEDLVEVLHDDNAEEEDNDDDDDDEDDNFHMNHHADVETMIVDENNVNENENEMDSGDGNIAMKENVHEDDDTIKGQDEENLDAQQHDVNLQMDDEDEEIHSSAEEDDDVDEDEDDDDDDDDDDCEYDDDEEDAHDIVIHNDDEDYGEAGPTHLVFGRRNQDRQQEPEGEGEEEATSGAAAAFNSLPKDVADRRRLIYLQASLKVLTNQYPLQERSVVSRAPSVTAKLNASAGVSAVILPPVLSISAERDLLTSILNIVHPPKAPVNAKMILRRAPTQEDFFRGSLSRNPISLQHLRKEHEPTIRDLRQHIATDLQMGDSAELIELMVANKILDIDLKLRVVIQVVWKQYLMENGVGGSSRSGSGDMLGSSSSALSSLLSSGGSSRARTLLSSRGGLSMILSGAGIPAFGSGPGSMGSMVDRGSDGITEDTPLSELPPMIVTYRLTGVDGEATEDTVTTLDDPEAPSVSADPEQVEKRLEQEFGLTRIVTAGRGVPCLLKSVERNVKDVLRKIRRDDVGDGENITRNHFKTSSPYPGLSLLSNCAKLPSNRKILLEARAPTILLRLLLDVLHALEDKDTSQENPTAKELQELIEVLASDMLSSDGMVKVRVTSSEPENDYETVEDASTLRLLLSSIENSSLSSPLRNVIAKLLPYLTYGMHALSKELASEFDRHVVYASLADYEQRNEDFSNVLMSTCVQASISLAANDVCNSLRSELLQCGYVDRIIEFILVDFPSEPPPWTAPLWRKGEKTKLQASIDLWRKYVQRGGLNTAFEMLIGLSRGHNPMREAIGNYSSENKGFSFIQACHWLESTSDSTSNAIKMKSLGLVAETLLDELKEDGSPAASRVKAYRTATRQRKKEIAMERRNKALQGMSGFANKKRKISSTSQNSSVQDESADVAGRSVRSTAASLFAPVLGLFGNAEDQSPSTSSKRRKTDTSDAPSMAPVSNKPAWMTEMEKMEDETGLTCAVCQEGQSLQPKELLGLYAYVKKVIIPPSQCGNRRHIDGTTLICALPKSLPKSLSKSYAVMEWFQSIRVVSENLKQSTPTSLSILGGNRLSSGGTGGRMRDSYFTTTVSAGNPIHLNCHNRARQADRNHPKAPKSEWEGATLRNSRVKCNIILPLVTSRSCKVPLVAVDVALTEHQTAVSNLLGARPKSMLWNILHDVRLLLLRICYGEPLNADCQGGSLLSNIQLIFHQLLMADMFEKDAQVDSPEIAQHARHLSAGYLVAASIVGEDAPSGRGQQEQYTHKQLYRGLAESSFLASLTCILFHNEHDDSTSTARNLLNTSASSDTGHNNKDDNSNGDNDDDKNLNVKDTPPKARRWLIGRDYFLRGLFVCAGRRHALGVEGSGCVSSSRSSPGANRSGRSGVFSSWFTDDDIDVDVDVNVDEDNEDNDVDEAEELLNLRMATIGNDDLDESDENRVRRRRRLNAIKMKIERASGSGGGSGGGTNASTTSTSSTLEAFKDALWPMLIYFVIMDKLSEGFISTSLDDAMIDDLSNELVMVIKGCSTCHTVSDLLKKANIDLEESVILEEFKHGLMTTMQ